VCVGAGLFVWFGVVPWLANRAAPPSSAPPVVQVQTAAAAPARVPVDAIPLEDKIDILKNKLKDFDKEKVKYFDKVAAAERDRDTLKKNVDAEAGRLDMVWADIQARSQKLDSDTALVNNRAKRDAFKKQLSADFDAYQIERKALESKKTLLDARTNALEDGRAQLATLESKRTELAANLTKMDAELKLARQQQGQSNLSIKDDDLDKLTADADKLADSVSEQKRSLEVQKEYGVSGVTPAPAPAAADDVLKRIEDFKKAQEAGGPDVKKP
jgi:chromosome segregation ATPase